MKVPRICVNPGCLYVMPARAIKYGEDQEENRKLEVIDMQTRCPKCNARLTQYVHKVWDYVKANEEVLKTFGVVSGDQKKVTEAKQETYKAARKFTEEQLEKDIQKYKPRA